MPLYEFRCGACQKEFEAYVSSHKRIGEPRACPECQAPSSYAGISQVTVGKEGYFGLITTDGQRYRGSLPRSS